MKVVVLAVCAVLMVPKFAIAEGLKIISDDWPPFSYKQGSSLTGFSVELIDQLIRDTGIAQDGNQEIWPWQRSYRTIQEEPNILLTGMTRTEEREELFKWVGPISPREIWLYCLASREDINLKSLDDAKSYTIGVERGAASAIQLENLGFEANKQLKYVTNEIQNLGKFLLGRVDFVAFSIAEMSWNLKQLDPPVSMATVKPAILLSGGYGYYFALSKQVPDSTVTEMQKALDQMKQDGRYSELWRKYME